jgi:predicted dehydrogenase
MAGEPLLLCAGLGSVGRRHLRNLQSLGHSRLVLYRSRFGDALPDAAQYPVEHDLAQALAHRPDAVIVSNPTALHLPLALPAARQGCHVFVEKPLSDSLEGVVALAREVEARGSIVLIGYQFRYHPVLRRVKAWLEDGAIGRLVSAHVHWGEYLPGWHPWEDYRRGYSARRDLGGGVLLTLSHPFDYLRWLAGEVARVHAVQGRLSGLEIDVEDTAQVTLELAGGALGQVYLDYVEDPPSHALRLVGRDGVIVWDESDQRALLRTRRGACEPAFAPHGFARNDLFREEMRHFLACLAGDDSPACTLHDGARALEIALAARRSAEEGRSIDV